MTNFHLKVPDSVKTLIADNSWIDGGGAGDVKKCNSIKFQEILVSAAAWQLEIEREGALQSQARTEIELRGNGSVRT